jgi:N-acetylglucosaminyldiphosphoundecaprenol N-acetyl-beta-D-mannosaminyltransferase
MDDLPIAFLGVFLSNLKKDEVVEAIFSLMKKYKADLQPRYIATVNVDFLVNANYANRARSHDQELINILRNASLVTIDGMPILWACRLLGTHVHERVTGIDLFPALLKTLDKQKKSIFLLGGQEQVLQLCQLYLSTEYPHLILAGSASPKIDCKGEQLEFSIERDSLLVEQINDCKPDILFINLGNPKQELWFDRVKKNLRVPISMGIGGALDLFTEVIPRAPLWIQNSGLEWFYRLTQEPKRLWKRYLKDIFQFPYWILPAIIYHNLNSLFFKISTSLFPYKSQSIEPRLFLSSEASISFIRLPRLFDAEKVGELNAILEDLHSQDALILDFEAVKHLSLESIALLLKLSQRACKDCKPLLFLKLKWNVKMLLRVHKFNDVMRSHLCCSLQELLNRLHQAGLRSTFYDSIQQDYHSVVISFFGHMDRNINHEEYLSKMMPILAGKNCILDLCYCPYANQTELSLLLKLKKIQEKQDRRFTIQGINPSSIY